jgi:hypothetical protein
MSALYDLGHDGRMDTITSTKKQGNARAAQTPISLLLCPTRRAVRLYPCVIYVNAGTEVYNCDPVSETNRSDYGANGGSNLVMWGGGPSPSDAYAGQGFGNMGANNGVGSQRSMVTSAEITDGMANTYLVGEKYHDPLNYATGRDYGDDHAIQTADDYDRFCWSDQPPIRDRPGVADFFHWGSAHIDGFNVAMADVSVRFVNFSIEPGMHRALGTRNGGETVDLGKL